MTAFGQAAPVEAPAFGRLLFVGEAAALLNRSEQAFRYQLDKGEIPHAKVGGRVVVKLSDLEAYVEAEFAKAASA